MKCFNGSKDVAQPEPEMLHFRHMVRLFVFLLLPRKLERQQQKGVDTRDECRDQMSQESFSKQHCSSFEKK